MLQLGARVKKCDWFKNIFTILDAVKTFVTNCFHFLLVVKKFYFRNAVNTELKSSAIRAIRLSIFNCLFT